MNIAATFIRRPVATTLLVLSILIFGIMGYRLLPVSDLPTVDFPTIQVNASLPGASPETMAASVATPLEKQFSTIAGVTSISSTNSQGSTSITLQFDLSRDIDAAAQDVQSMIARAQRQLPPGMPSPPSYQKVNPADSPVLFLTLSSPTLPLSQLDQYAQNLLAQRLSMVTGVAQVNVFGSQKFAVRVDVDPLQLASRQIGIDQVAQAIAAANVNRPTGTLYGPDRNFVIQANGQLLDAPSRTTASSSRTATAARCGSTRSRTSTTASRTSATPAGTTARARSTSPSSGSRAPTPSRSWTASRRCCPSSRSSCRRRSSSRSAATAPSRSASRCDDVKFTLLLTVGLVVLVIFLFLRNVSATIIPSLALPFSIVGTFAVMYVLGYSLDNLSLMALTLSVGFVVDDAIVMLENIVRHMEMGKPRMQAALDGSKEIAFTIVSMTLSLAAVFIPVLFMGGIVGRLMHEFAVTIGVGDPRVGLRLADAHADAVQPVPEGAALDQARRALQRDRGGSSTPGCADTRGRCARRSASRASRWSVSALLLAGTVYLFTVIPKGFIPSEDTGPAAAARSRRPGHRLRRDGGARQGRHAASSQNDPNVAGVHGERGRRSGGGGGGAAERRPEAARAAHADGRPGDRGAAAEARARSRHPRVPVEPAGDPHRRHDVAQPVSVHAAGSRHRRAVPRGAGVRGGAAERRGIQDVTSDLQLRNPQLDVELDRDQIAALGLTVDQVELALTSAYGTRQVSQIYAPDNQYQVIMQVAPQFQRDPAALSMLYVTAPGNKLVPLSTVATTRQTVGPLSVNHTGQLPSVTISFNLKPGVALGDAVGERAGDRPRRRCPATVSGSFQGTAQAFQDSMRGLGWVLAAGDLRDLRRARHALRELHPPADDSLGAAVGGLRRAADAAALQDRPEHLRVRRHHHAGRAGEEERHHDDRLRDRGAAQREAERRPTRSTRPAWSGSARS